MKKITLLLAFMLANLCAFSQQTLIFNETFDTANLPTGWVISHAQGTTDFTFGSNIMPGGGSANDFTDNAAIFDDDAAGSGVNNVVYLQTPYFDASVYSRVNLVYTYALEVLGSGGNGEYLQAKLTDGTLYVTLDTYQDTDIAPTTSNIHNIKQIATNLGFDLTHLAVYFKYDDNNTYSWGAGIDDVVIWGEAPQNNNCTSATSLTVGTTFADNAITADNLAATPSGETPAPTCGNFGTGEDVWFTVTPVSGSITIETAAPASGTGIDTVMTAYSGSCGAFVELDCNDDGGAGSYSKLVLTGLTPNAPIYIRINEYLTNAEGYFQISAYDTPPANDDCTGATVLSGFYTTPVTLSGEDATSATNNAGFITPGGSCGSGMNDGVWYTFTAAHTGEVTLNVSPTAWDPEIGVYTGSCGNFVCLGNVDDGLTGDTETITFNVEFDTTYYINVGHYSSNTDNAEGVFDLEVSYSCSATPTNDMCGTAWNMSSVFTNPYVNAVDASCATGGIVSSCGNAMNDGVWFKFTASNNGDVEIIITPDNSWDPQIGVFSGDCTNLTCVDTADNSFVNGGVETITVPVTNGTTYYVNVGHWSGLNDLMEGFFTIDASFNPTNAVTDENINSLEIFPNPVTDILTIQAQETISKISIFNQIGQLVKEINPNLNNTQMDLSNLNNGIYFVKVEAGDNTNTKRIVKK